MIKTKISVFRDPWDAAPRLHTGNDCYNDCYYICISGNSGAGKSSLLKKIANDFARVAPNTIAIDESALHHPFISSLFWETRDYGFQIQLNFMLQRTLLVKRWLDLGYNVIMERGHLEDPVFIEHLRQLGDVSDKEYQAYMSLWACLDERLRRPDVIVFLDVPPQVSLARIEDDESKGRRPHEFPDSNTRENWIKSWYQWYVQRFKELSQSTHAGTKIIQVNEHSSTENISKTLSDVLGLKYEPDI